MDPRPRSAESGTLTESMGISDVEIDRRKQWLSFTDDDEKRLQKLNQIAQAYADPMIEDLYKHFLSVDETRAFFSKSRSKKLLSRKNQM